MSNTKLPALSDIDALARVHSISYASPHHFVMTVDGLRAAILAAPSPDGKAEQEEAPSDTLRIACITLDGSTLYIPAKCITDFGIGDDDGETYTLTFKTMTRAEFDALGEFDGF